MDETQEIEKLLANLYHDYGKKESEWMVKKLERVDPIALREVLSRSPFIQRVKARYNHCIRFKRGEVQQSYFTEVVSGYKRTFKCTRGTSKRIIGYWELLKSLFEKCSLNRPCNPGSVCNIDESVCVPQDGSTVVYTIGDKQITGPLDKVVDKIKKHYSLHVDDAVCSNGELRGQKLETLRENFEASDVVAFMDSRGGSVYCELKSVLIKSWHNQKPRYGIVLSPNQVQQLKNGVNPKSMGVTREFYQLLQDRYVLKEDIENIYRSDTYFYVLVPTNYVWVDTDLQPRQLYIIVPVEKRELDIDDLDMSVLSIY